MSHIQVFIPLHNNLQDELLSSQLFELGAEGVEEQDDQLIVYFPEALSEEPSWKAFLRDMNYTFTIENLPRTNWNATWESNFDPVIIPECCTIRAHFHKISVTTPYEIFITPKMSFGTGHHATTQLMMQAMMNIDLKGKRIFDFGTGTGVLAIFAALLKASHITATDNDEWSVENAQENVMNNHVDHLVQVSDTDITQLNGPYDVIMANINRHILLEYMPHLKRLLAPHGQLLMSGILLDDEAIIKEAAQAEGLSLVHAKAQGQWLQLSFVHH